MSNTILKTESTDSKKDKQAHRAYTSTSGAGIFQYKPTRFGPNQPVGLLLLYSKNLISTDPNCSFLQAQADKQKYNYTELVSGQWYTPIFESDYTSKLTSLPNGKSPLNYNGSWNACENILENCYYSQSTNFTTSTYTPTQYAIPMISINGTYIMSWSYYIAHTPYVNLEQWADVGDTTVPVKSPISYLTDTQWQAIVDTYKIAVDTQDVSLVSRVIDMIYFAKVMNQSNSNQQLSVEVGYGQRVFNAGSQTNSALHVAQVSMSVDQVSAEMSSGSYYGGATIVTFYREYNGNSDWGCTWSVGSNADVTVDESINQNSLSYIYSGLGAFNWSNIGYWLSHNNQNPDSLNPIPPVGWGWWPGGQFTADLSSNGTYTLKTGSMNYASTWQNYINDLFGDFINLNGSSSTWPVVPNETVLDLDLSWEQVSGDINVLKDILGSGFWMGSYTYNYFVRYNSTADEGNEQRKDYFSGYLEAYPINCTYNKYSTTAYTGDWNVMQLTAQLTVPVMSFSIEPLMGKHHVKKNESELEKVADYYYNITDHIVAAYYNCLLQKEEYWLHEYNQGGPATALQKVFALGVKFNFTSEILTEIINQHPFKVVPSTIQTMVNVINSGTTATKQAVTDAAKVVTKMVAVSESGGKPVTETQTLQPADTAMASYQVDNNELINEINLFLTTPVPSSQSIYDEDPTLWNNLQAVFSEFTTQANTDIVLADGTTAKAVTIDSTPLPSPFNVNGELMPSTFRELVKQTMGMGAFIQHVEAYLRLGALHNLLIQKNPITSANMELPNVSQVTASPYTIPETNMKNIGTVDTSRNHQDLDSVRKQMDSTISHIEQNLIYPAFDSIMEVIKDDVAAVRQLTEDRLHGMSYAVYAPELRYVFAKRVGITHRLIHMFSCCVKTVKFVVTPFYDLLKDLDAKLGNIVSNLVMKPLTQTVATIAKVGLSMLISGSDLVSPGSELLTWISDADIERPIPFPLSPFGLYIQPDQQYPKGLDNRLFSKITLTNNNQNQVQTIASIECIVPGIGFSKRSGACCADVYYNESTNSYALEVNIYNNVVSVAGTKFVIPNSKSDSDNSKPSKDDKVSAKKEVKTADSDAGITYVPTIVPGNDSKMVIYNVTPGVHSIQFITAAGSVRMWFSATETLASDGNSFVKNNLTESTNPNEYVKVGTGGFICFVPDPVVELDGRISLTKTFHKWILAGLHIPYFVFPRGEDKNYHAAINYLESLRGFDNMKSHICTDGMTYAYIADGAAVTMAWGMAIKQICTAGIKQSIESFALASEYAANIAHITFEYNKARAANVLNAYLNNTATINSILATAWPCQGDGAVNMQLWESLQDDVQQSPDFTVPGWYPESWERLLGDVILGIAKMTFFTYLQHRVFKKINAKATVVAKTKTKLSSVLWNKYKRHEQEVDTGKDVDKDLGNKDTAKDEKKILRKQDAELDNSFIEDRDLAGLRAYTLDNSKSVKDILKDQTTMAKVLDGIESVLSSIGSFRGLN